MTYDVEIAVLAALSKRVRTMAFSNMFSNDLTRDLWHEGREWPSEPISMVTKVACFPAESRSLRSC